MCRPKKTSKLRVTGLCADNSPGTGEFSLQRASYAENVSIWWRHHDEKTTSMPWLLMPWLLVSPDHHQPWHWLCRIIKSSCYLRNNAFRNYRICKCIFVFSRINSALGLTLIFYTTYWSTDSNTKKQYLYSNLVSHLLCLYLRSKCDMT